MNSHQINFFVVEDEEPARKALIGALKEDETVSVAGEAGTIEEAWKGILRTSPDALFLDIELQGGTAYQLLQRMRDESIEIPPVIIITGHLNFELAQQALNQFRDCVLKILTKPYRNNAVNKHKISHIDHDDHVVYLNANKRGIGIEDVYYQGVLRMLKG